MQARNAPFRLVGDNVNTSCIQIFRGVLRLLIYAIIFFYIVKTVDIGVPAIAKLERKHFLEKVYDVVSEVVLLSSTLPFCNRS